MKRWECPRCLRALCYCHLLKPFVSGPQVVILRHPREARERSAVNTAWMAHLCIRNSRLLDGMDFKLDLEGAALVFPGGRASLAQTPSQLIFLDGSWKQARALLRRNEQLQQLPRLSLTGTSLREQPAANFLTTAEAIYQALELLGQKGHENLLEVLEFMAKRAMCGS